MALSYPIGAQTSVEGEKKSTSVKTAHGKPLVELFKKQQKLLFRYQSPSDSNIDYANPQCTVQQSLCGERMLCVQNVCSQV